MRAALYRSAQFEIVEGGLKNNLCTSMDNTSMEKQLRVPIGSLQVAAVLPACARGGQS
ncbi:MAG: hypothetical protein RL635_1414 [Chloroflexota bacterium]|jgi:hypothetical protein